MRLLKAVIIALSFVSLSGCGYFGKKKPEAAPAPETAAIAEPEVVLSPREYYLGALEALQVGNADQAKGMLDKLLVLEPANKVAASLLEQINADPVSYFGKDYFSYKSQYGESISSIAKKFLNDPFKFYILARYNDIADPSHLDVGQVLKIPGKKPVEREPVEIKKPAPSASDLRLIEARRLYGVAKYQEAITALENALREERDNGDARELMVTVYVEYARSLARSGRPTDARGLLEKAMASYPDRRLTRQNELVGQQLEADRQYQEGLRAQKSGAVMKAYEHYNRAVELLPENEMAARKLREVQPAVIEEYHRLATKAFRAQDMDQAIRYWDKVLHIDPGHALAKANRSKAVELQQRLKKIK